MNSIYVDEIETNGIEIVCIKSIEFLLLFYFNFIFI